MLRRSIVSRASAVALLLAPAFALAGDAPAHHPSKDHACVCAMQQGAAATTASPKANAAASTPSEDVQRIWASP